LTTIAKILKTTDKIFSQKKRRKSVAIVSKRLEGMEMDGKNGVKVTAHVGYLRPGDGKKEDSKAIFDFFTKIFSDFREVSEEEIRELRVDSTGKSYDLLLLDCREMEGEEERCHRILSEVKRLDPNLKRMILYTKGGRYSFNCFVEEGIRYFFPVPWNQESIRYVLKPLIEIMTLPQRLHQCHLELKECRHVLEQATPVTEEGCQILLKRIQTEESFYRLKAEEMEKYIHDIVNMNSLLLQSKMEEKQREFLGRVDQAASMLRKVIEELREYSGSQNMEERHSSHPFNLNSILTNSSNMTHKQFEAAGMELIFDVDRSVPSRITGNPVLLGQVLVNLFDTLVDLDEADEVLLRLYMDASGKDPEEKRLHFELIKRGESPHGSAHFVSLLRNSQRIRETEKWIAEMGGRFSIARRAEDPLISFILPVRQVERRSYRLPSREWMEKSMLIIDENEVTAKVLENMLGYFHFHVERVSDIQGALQKLYNRSFDMIFVKEELFEEFVREAISARREAKLVMITRKEKEHRKNAETVNWVDAFLPLPFTQQHIFDVLLEVYSKDRLEGVQETLNILRENLVFLLGGETALYVGRSGSDMLTLQGLLEGAKIVMLKSDNAEQARKLLPNTNLVLIDDHIEGAEWEKILRLCHEECQKRPVFALLHNTTTEKLEELKMAGISNYIESPVDPEAFYRLLLDELLEYE
jgi:CheY-like chemotaxis protein